MHQRLKYWTVAPAAYKAMLALQEAVEKSGLEKSLLELIKIRASQINKCAFCLHLHTRDARKEGVSEARIYLLQAWRESSLYSPRERAALAWAEAVTLVSESHVPDEVYEEVRQYFDEHEIISLTMAIISINSWNRMSIAFRKPAGAYVSKRQPLVRAEAN